jgi:hypothetical protein
MAFLLEMGFCLLNSIATQMFLNRSPELDARPLCNFVARSIRPLFALQASQRAYLVALHRVDTRRAVLRPADV